MKITNITKEYYEVKMLNRKRFDTSFEVRIRGRSRIIDSESEETHQERFVGNVLKTLKEEMEKKYTSMKVEINPGLFSLEINWDEIGKIYE